MIVGGRRGRRCVSVRSVVVGRAPRRRGDGHDGPAGGFVQRVSRQGERPERECDRQGEPAQTERNQCHHALHGSRLAGCELSPG